MKEFENKYEAPALARGLGVLKILEEEGACSLEKISQKTNAPKSSLLRLLDTLIDLDLVVRNSKTRLYENYGFLLIKENPHQETNIKNRQDTMRYLADFLCRTVEWYVPSQYGMVLIERVVPSEGEIQIRARVGFVREWDHELESVSALAYAYHFNEVSYPENCYKADDMGVQCPLDKKDVALKIDFAFQNKYSFDEHYNSNGIRRCGAAVFLDSSFFGVLALVEHKSINYERSQNHILDILQEKASILSR